MVKRELSASDDEDELLLKSIPGPGFEPLSGVKQERARQTKATLIAAHDDTVVGTNGQIDLAVGKRGKAVEGVKKPKPEKAVKSRWTPEEDQIVAGMMEKLIKENIWGLAKSDGRLVSRTSYGVQYHALMLLKQGIGKGPGSSDKD